MSELGESLKAERLEQGLTLQDVYERTRVSVGVLQNLEEGHYERIGTPLLVRNFIRTYCTALGIDPEPLLESHSGEILACDRQQEGIEEYRRLSLGFRYNRRKWLVLTGLFVILIVGAVVAGTWIAQKRAKLTLSQSMTKEVIPQEELPSDLPRGTAKTEAAAPDSAGSNQPEQVAPESTPSDAGPLQLPEIKEQSVGAPEQETASGTTGTANSPPPQEVTEAQAPVETEVVPETPPERVPQETVEPAAPSLATEKPAPQGEQHVLSAEASQDVWVQVRIDGEETHNTLMKPGDKREWKVKENARIVLGNAGGISMSWDGKSLKPLGKSGEVVRFQLPDPNYMQTP